MHETGLGKSLECQEKENKGLVHSEGARREEALFESGSMEAQAPDSPSPGCLKWKILVLKISGQPEDHHRTM